MGVVCGRWVTQLIKVYEVSGDGELERWVASCGRILLFVRGVGVGYVFYLWEVKY